MCNLDNYLFAVGQDRDPLRYLNGDLQSCRSALPVGTLPIGQYPSYFTIQITFIGRVESFRNFLGLRASLSHVALHTEYNFWKEYILRFHKTPSFKNLNNICAFVTFPEK